MMRLSAAAFAFGLFLLSAATASAQGRTVRVPQDARTLEAAISRVADGGVIEMAAGTYPTPARGFLIGNLRKGFTIRAAGGAVVVLDGGGARPVLRFINSNRSRGRRVTFEGITFRNGASVAPNISGGVTVEKAEAVFRNCAFEGNRADAPTTGGGAVKVFSGSTATFLECRWEGNSSQNRGGAMVVRNSEVTVQGGSFTGNRTNLPGHKPGSSGGAVYVLDATLRVSGVRFEGNQAGWTGGAIYGFGDWDGSGAQIEVTRSTFTENQAVADPCCVNPEVTTGGAIHVENLTALTVHQSGFVRNRADSGGAIDGFRAFIEVHGSVFQGNQSTAARPESGIGGAIAVFSNDGVGDVNRRSSRLTVTRSFLEGGSGVERAARSGGCLFAAGDSNRAYGENGITPLGTLDENRARVTLRHVVLSDCDVEATTTPAFGGGLTADLVDLTMEDSMVLASDARGEGSGGGGLAIREESIARIARTTFANNSAERWGGAMFVTGSDLDVRDSRFFGNDVVPGVFEPISQSRGAAILTIPRMNAARPRNVAGVVAGSSFAENNGLAIFEIDPAEGPVNDVRYDGNRFGPGAFGDLVYLNTLAAPNGTSVFGLNSLFVNRPGRVSTQKSTVPNARVSSPREGALVAVPAPESVGAEPTSPQGTLLAYAWAGPSASLAGQALPAKSGLLPVAPGDYVLAVAQSAVASARVTGSCTAGPYLCLNNNRFRAEVIWKANGGSGPGQAEALSGDTGYFWFFDRANVELVVKVLDGRGANGHFWVFYGALTNVEYTLRITDTVTGSVKTYTNPAGRFASAGDTSAFPAKANKEMEEDPVSWEPEELEAVSSKASCAPGPLTLCLSNGRVRVELNWKDFAGVTGSGQAVPLTNDTGYFWFTSPTNVEVVVKVLDGRPLNGHFWVFYGALTNQEYTITVTDMETGRSKTYFNPINRFGSVGDTSAIPGS